MTSCFFALLADQFVVVCVPGGGCCHVCAYASCRLPYLQSSIFVEFITAYGWVNGFLVGVEFTSRAVVRDDNVRDINYNTMQ